MTHDQQSLALAILCLVMVLQIILMAHWHQAMQRDARAAMLKNKNVLGSCSAFRDSHYENRRELAYLQGQVKRLELAIATLVQRLPNLQSVDSLQQFVESGFEEDWQHQSLLDQETLLGVNPSVKLP